MTSPTGRRPLYDRRVSYDFTVEGYDDPGADVLDTGCRHFRTSPRRVMALRLTGGRTVQRPIESPVGAWVACVIGDQPAQWFARDADRCVVASGEIERLTGQALGEV